MSLTIYPSKYLQVNAQQTKQLNMVLEIDGLDDVLTIVPTFEKVRYGDPRLTYGLPGLVYGGLVQKEHVQPILSIDSGLTISQKIEPEQGRGGITTLSIPFIDKNGYMSELISPGVLLDEPLGNKLVTVWLGFTNTSYPDDYFVVFRGYITSTISSPSKVTLQLSDANVKRRQDVFVGGTTVLTSAIDNVQTSIPVNQTLGFYQQILGPHGTYDSSVKTYIKIDDEWMTYGSTGLATSIITVLSRGGSNSRGTTAVNHDINTAVANGVQLQGNAIDLALKVMLSGWNGPWKTGVVCHSLGTTLSADPSTNVIAFDTDVVQSYGLTIGDMVTVSGSTSGNDGDYFITDVQDIGDDTNRLVFVGSSLNYENPATSVSLAFRSQYDTLPTECGLKCTPQEIDVATFQAIRQLYINGAIDQLQLFMQDSTDGKDFIESEMMLPFGMYSITRYGRLSVTITKPPIADQKLLVLDQTNILDPQNIQIQRATNNRRFFNIIQYNFDMADNGVFESTLNILDTTSLTKINLQSTLPIQSSGLKTTLGGAVVASERGRFLLNRYKKAAYELKLKVNWSVGSLIEIGDSVTVVDNGTLQITNFETGVRDIGVALFEVIGRDISVKEGNVNLTLLSNVGFTLDQRFATISPSSLVASGSTTTSVRIQDSYNALFPGNEQRKWTQLIGSQIKVHDYGYTQVGTTILTGFDPADRYRMLVNPALSFTPSAGDIVDVDDYGITTNANFNKTAKLLYAFNDPTLTVTSGVSATQFNVSSGDAAKVVVDQSIIVHNSDYSILSVESRVVSVVGTLVTVQTALGFTPSAGQLVDAVGFQDSGGPYRYLG